MDSLAGIAAHSPAKTWPRPSTIERNSQCWANQERDDIFSTRHSGGRQTELLIRFLCWIPHSKRKAIISKELQTWLKTPGLKVPRASTIRRNSLALADARALLAKRRAKRLWSRPPRGADRDEQKFPLPAKTMISVPKMTTNDQTRATKLW